jgi:hypothetical protein
MLRWQQLHGAGTGWLRNRKRAALPTATHSWAGLSAAGHSSIAVVAGSWRVLASPDDLVSAKTRKAAVARRIVRSFRPTPPQAASTRSMPKVASDAPPAPTRLPIGGATSAGGGGSTAPPVEAALATVALSLVAILFMRFSLDHATWRSTLLASRLEDPG